MNDILQHALYYHDCGLSVVPRSIKDKFPVVKWAHYQEQMPDRDTVEGWFTFRPGLSDPLSICIIAGKASGNLVVLDFDEVGIFDEWMQIVIDNDLAVRLANAPIVCTPSGGRHIYVRSEVEVGHNSKLAYTKDKVVRIETREHGGLSAAPPSMNIKGLSYKLLSGDFSNIPVVDAKLVCALLAFARLFNEWVPEERIFQPAATIRVDGQELRPGDDFNERGDIRPFLTSKGWRFQVRRGEVEMWTRPGKDDDSTSATLGYGRPYLFYPFSSNAAPFDSDRAYSSFAVYAILEHSGDFRNATRALADLEYGTPKEDFKRAILTTQKEKQAKSIDTAEQEDPNTPAILLGRHELTDTGNANRFVRMWRDEVKYDHDRGKWYIWNGAYWKIDASATVVERAKKTALRIYAEAADEGLDEATRTAFIKHAKASLNAAKIAAMIQLAQSDPSVAINHGDWDKDPWLFNVKNGTIELRTGGFREHARADYITHMAEVEYDPIATCPIWNECMEKWQPVEAVRSFLQRGVGYSLTGSVREQKLFYLYGSGSNGKSAFLEALQVIMGDYWYKSQSETFMKINAVSAGNANPDIMPMIGTRFLTTSEVSQNHRLNESLVKDITGGDTIAARALFREQINFKPQCKIWFFGNHKPSISGNDIGIWRRFLLVNFATYIPEDQRDRSLIEKLMIEAPGILNWALEGCRVWRVDGLKTPEEINNATAEYREAEDVIGRFLADCAIFKDSNTIQSSVFYAAYATWCKGSGEYAIKQKSFTEDLVQRGIEKKRISTGVIFVGVTARTNNEINDINSK